MISPCDKVCGNKTASGYCKTTACINPQYSNIGTAQYRQGVKNIVITNADRIRAMSDEELAQWMFHYAEDFASRYVDTYTMSKTFIQDALDWLKQEAQI